MAAKAASNADRVKAALKKGTPTHFWVRDGRRDDRTFGLNPKTGYIKNTTLIIGEIDDLKTRYAKLSAMVDRHEAKFAGSNWVSVWLDLLDHADTPRPDEILPSKLSFSDPRPPTMSPWFLLAPFRDLFKRSLERDHPKLSDPFIPAHHTVDFQKRNFGAFVVSRELRAAIEEFEPGKEIFLPLELWFADGVVEGYSWILDKQRVHSEVWRGHDDCFRIGDPLVDEGPLLDGVYWRRCIGGQYLVSASMVERLRSLMPVSPVAEFEALEILPVIDIKPWFPKHGKR